MATSSDLRSLNIRLTRAGVARLGGLGGAAGEPYILDLAIVLKRGNATSAVFEARFPDNARADATRDPQRALPVQRFSLGLGADRRPPLGAAFTVTTVDGQFAGQVAHDDPAGTWHIVWRASYAPAQTLRSLAPNASPSSAIEFLPDDAPNPEWASDELSGPAGSNGAKPAPSDDGRGFKYL